MSAANRGAPRMGLDNYPTPAWCTKRILEILVPQQAGFHSPDVLEPCAGEGAITRAVLAYMPQANVVQLDIRNLPGVLMADATVPFAPLGYRYELLITNPPFSLAAEIILAQRDTARVCAYLLRSSFKLEGELANGDPYSFRHDMPAVFQLPERPSFIASDHCAGGEIPDGGGGVIHALACDWAQKVPIGEPKPAECPHCGGKVRRSTSDASEYAWCVWDTDRRSVGSLQLLPATPLEERSEKAAARAAKRKAKEAKQ